MLIEKLGRTAAAFALVTAALAGSLGTEPALAPPARAEVPAQAEVPAHAEVPAQAEAGAQASPADPGIRGALLRCGGGRKVMPLDADDGSRSTCTTSKRVWNWGKDALRSAQLQEGTPYGLGCEPGERIDCSCLVQWSFTQLPGFGHFERDSRSQEAWLDGLANDGRRTKVDAIRVSIADVQRGDLIFSTIDADPVVDHVAFYWSEGYVYDAPGPSSPAGLHARQLRSPEVVAVYRVIGVS